MLLAHRAEAYYWNNYPVIISCEGNEEMNQQSDKLDLNVFVLKLLSSCGAAGNHCLL